MNIYELNELIECIEKENRPDVNTKLLTYYYNLRKQLMHDLSKDIMEIMQTA